MLTILVFNICQLVVNTKYNMKQMGMSLAWQVFSYTWLKVLDKLQFWPDDGKSGDQQSN